MAIQKTILFLIDFESFKNVIYIKCKQDSIFNGFSIK